MKVRRLQRINSYPSKCIIAMDEVALWLDMPADTTLDIKRTRSIPIKTTGHEKHRFTVCLAACADGCKIWPFILFKRKRPVKALQGITIVGQHSKKSSDNCAFCDKSTKFGICIEKFMINRSGYWAIINLTCNH